MMIPSIGLAMMGRRTWLGAAAAGLAAPSLWAAESGIPRVALVIGNAAYPQQPLLNPVRDALAMSGLLRQMGFQVIEARDAGKAQMEAALAAARSMLQGRQGIAMLYYAGHGLQLDWQNYLVPVDARLSSAGEIAAQTLGVGAVLQAFGQAGTRMNILVLDACRDNPFPAVVSGQGLAPMDAPTGTFFAYATAPGNVAEDGSPQDGNGLFTGFLLQEMQRKDARIEDVFKRVRLQVRQASHGRQIPWESTSLEDDFVFATGARVEAGSASQRDTEFEAERADWDRIKGSSNAQDFYAFLQRHPNGRISELAQFRLDRLARPAVQPLLALTMLAAGADRYRLGDSWEVQITDHVSSDQTRRSKRTVTAISGDRVEVNAGEFIYDQMGGTLRNIFGAKNPAVILIPSNLQVGKRWRSAFINTTRKGQEARNFYDHRVTALEELDVPAGRFTAFRIQAQGESIVPAGRGLKLHTIYWVDPATMTMLRQDWRHVSLNGGRVFEHASSEVVSRSLRPRS